MTSRCSVHLFKAFILCGLEHFSYIDFLEVLVFGAHDVLRFKQVWNPNHIGPILFSRHRLLSQEEPTGSWLVSHLDLIATVNCLKFFA